MTSLPAPSAEQLATSLALTERIRDAIVEAGGWIPFVDYMRMALYTPNLGYYSGGSRKFGAEGDFITAPEISPLFARCLARPVTQILAESSGDVMEVGAGSGRLAADLLSELAALGRLPRRYLILELSGELAARQRETLAHAVPELLDRVQWLSALPQDFIGCIIGNEVLDAMPCRLLHWHNDVWQERGVIWQGGLRWEDRPSDAEGAATIPTDELPGDYLTETQPEAGAFVASLAACVAKGALILLDYGFSANEYYHPQRDRGTLMCHYRHHSLDDPFYLPGLVDITTHIDFSAIWRSAIGAGWRLEGYASQAGFLLDAGLPALLQGADPNDPAYFKQAAAIQKLLSPAEMGELFKAIAFSKNMDLPGLLAGFRQEDRSGSL